MYIGTSLGRCLPSILRGEVKQEEVGIIIARTRTETLEQFLTVVREYHSYGSLSDSRYDYYGLELSDVLALATKLWESGKIHQPRNFNLNDTGYLLPEMRYSLWMEVVPVYDGDNSSVIQAYEHYQTLKALVN